MAMASVFTKFTFKGLALTCRRALAHTTLKRDFTSNIENYSMRGFIDCQENHLEPKTLRQDLNNVSYVLPHMRIPAHTRMGRPIPVWAIPYAYG